MPSLLISHFFAMQGSTLRFVSRRTRPLYICEVAHIRAWSFAKAGSSVEMPAASLYLNIALPSLSEW